MQFIVLIKKTYCKNMINVGEVTLLGEIKRVRNWEKKRKGGEGNGEENKSY